MNYTVILAFKTCILFFNELNHDYLFVKACFMIYNMFFIKIVIFDLLISLDLGEIPPFTLYEYCALISTSSIALWLL